MNRFALTLATTILAAACSEPASKAAQQVTSAVGAPAAPQVMGSAGAEAQASDLDLQLGPPQPGYQRYEPTPIEVVAGGSNDWAQWVGGPLDQDYDVVDIRGRQSLGGHHALMYASTEAQPAGFTRSWQDADQLTTRLMGGVGGEGGAKANLPPGVVFRVKKGSYLVVQTHYLNVSESAITCRSILDVKLAPVDPTHRVASIMANTDVAIDLSPGAESALDVNCKVEQDLQFLQISNHMHAFGKSSLTEFTDPAGVLHELKRDDAWNYEWALNPNFTSFPLEAPMLVPAGSMLHTRCQWQNTSDQRQSFPSEMCVFFGFILAESDVYCRAGVWSVASAASSGGTGGAPGDVGGVSDAGAPNGCVGSSDQAIMNASDFDQRSTQCATACGLDPDVAGCSAPCFQSDVGLSPSCATCNAQNVACGAKNCVSQCVVDTASEACRTCVAQNCDPAYHACTGL